MTIFYHYFTYKFLKLGIFVRNNYLIRVLFLHDKHELEEAIKKNKNNDFYSQDIFFEGKNEFTNINKQLKDYLDGKLKQFNIQYKLNTTPFTAKVLKETSKIPYGKVSTYKEIANRIGNPNAYRAVGNALSSNPIPIIIPCHRVIRSNGEIGGFGKNPELKIKLLQHEGTNQIFVNPLLAV